MVVTGPSSAGLFFQVKPGTLILQGRISPIYPNQNPPKRPQRSLDKKVVGARPQHIKLGRRVGAVIRILGL
jgi:hypothetical protein